MSPHTLISFAKESTKALATSLWASTLAVTFSVMLSAASALTALRTERSPANSFGAVFAATEIKIA